MNYELQRINIAYVYFTYRNYNVVRKLNVLQAYECTHHFLPFYLRFCDAIIYLL